MTTVYCIKCKSKTEDVSPHVVPLTTAKGTRYQLRATCKDCSSKKCQFVSKQHAEGKGLITDLIKKFAPNTTGTIDQVQNTIGSIPFVGPLLGAVI